MSVDHRINRMSLPRLLESMAQSITAQNARHDIILRSAGELITTLGGVIDRLVAYQNRPWASHLIHHAPIPSDLLHADNTLVGTTVEREKQARGAALKVWGDAADLSLPNQDQRRVPDRVWLKHIDMVFRTCPNRATHGGCLYPMCPVSCSGREAFMEAHK